MGPTQENSYFQALEPSILGCTEPSPTQMLLACLPTAPTLHGGGDLPLENSQSYDTMPFMCTAPYLTHIIVTTSCMAQTSSWHRRGHPGRDSPASRVISRRVVVGRSHLLPHTMRGMCLSSAASSPGEGGVEQVGIVSEVGCTGSRPKKNNTQTLSDSTTTPNHMGPQHRNKHSTHCYPIQC